MQSDLLLFKRVLLTIVTFTDCPDIAGANSLDD